MSQPPHPSGQPPLPGPGPDQSPPWPSTPGAQHPQSAPWAGRPAGASQASFGSADQQPGPTWQGPQGQQLASQPSQAGPTWRGPQGPMGPGQQPAGPRLPRWFPLAALGGLVLIGLLVWLAVASTGHGAERYDLARAGVSDQQRTQAPDVADLTAKALGAAKAMDVDSGLKLLCKMPSTTDIEHLREGVQRAQKVTGKRNPDVQFKIEDMVQDGEEGHADVLVTSNEEHYAGRHETVSLRMRRDGSHWCIVDAS